MKRITRVPRKKIPENALFIGQRSPYANPFKVQKNQEDFTQLRIKNSTGAG